MATKKARNAAGGDKEPEFLGEPFNADEAHTKWPQRYQRGPAKRPDEEEDVMVRCQYRSAKVDDVYVMAGENETDYIGRITEFFEGTDRCHYFTCRWFFYSSRGQGDIQNQVCR